MKLRQALGLLSGLGCVALATLILSAPRVVAQETVTADVQEVRHYALTLDKSERAATAIQSINQLTASNAGLKAKMDAATSGKLPITEQAKYIDANFPQVTAIIHTNGLETREWIVLTGALINDIGWVGLKKMGMIKAYDPTKITAANAALIEANWNQYQAIGAKMSPPSSR
jgi:hypothetical protein